MNAISKWNIKTDTSAIVPLDKHPQPGLAVGNLDQLTGADKTQDTFLNDIEAHVDTKNDTKVNYGLMDRRTILTLKA